MGNEIARTRGARWRDIARGHLTGSVSNVETIKLICESYDEGFRDGYAVKRAEEDNYLYDPITGKSLP